MKDCIGIDKNGKKVIDCKSFVNLGELSPDATPFYCIKYGKFLRNGRLKECKKIERKWNKKFVKFIEGGKYERIYPSL